MKYYDNTDQFVKKELDSNKTKKYTFRTNKFYGVPNAITDDRGVCYRHIGSDKINLIGNLVCINNIIYKIEFYNMDLNAFDSDKQSILSSRGLVCLNPL